VLVVFANPNTLLTVVMLTLTLLTLSCPLPTLSALTSVPHFAYCHVHPLARAFYQRHQSQLVLIVVILFKMFLYILWYQCMLSLAVIVIAGWWLRDSSSCVVCCVLVDRRNWPVPKEGSGGCWGVWRNLEEGVFLTANVFLYHHAVIGWMQSTSLKSEQDRQICRILHAEN